jgi:hypothetical protein
MTLVSLICIRISHFLITNEAQPSLWLLPLLAGEGGDGGSVRITAFCVPPPQPSPAPSDAREGVLSLGRYCLAG